MASPDMDAFTQSLQTQLPGLKTQAQALAFQAAFEAFRGVINSILDGKPEDEAARRPLLDKAFEVVRMATEVTRMVADVPEAVSSVASEAFKQPPAVFTDYDVHRTMLEQIEGMITKADLLTWWGENRARIDAFGSSQLRNQIIDAARGRLAGLQ